MTMKHLTNILLAKKAVGLAALLAILFASSQLGLWGRFMENDTQYKLYIGPTCPYCLKVMNHMAEHDIKIEAVDVWSDSTQMAELIQLTGKRQVPCLVINGEPMLESSDIIEYLSKNF